MALSKLKLLQTLPLILIPLLSFFLNVQSQDTTSFSFDAFEKNSSGLTYQGSAHVPSGSNAIRLTEIDNSGYPASWDVGRVVYSKPVHLWQRTTGKKAAFLVTLSFVIKPATILGGAADGIVFFIAPVGVSIPSNSSGPNFGVFNSSGYANSLFAVEFDTYSNLGFDPYYRHIGVDINSRESKATVKFDSATGKLVTAFISYEPQMRIVLVTAACGSQYTTLKYNIDLSTTLPEWVQVGLSASTGWPPLNLGVHDIHSWYFTSTLLDIKDGGGYKKEEEARAQQYAIV